MLAATAGLAAATARAGDIICLEAESAQTVQPPMESVTVAGNATVQARKGMPEVSGGAFLQIAEGKGNPPKLNTGEADYTFVVQTAGQYFLWCRVWWEGECSNSFSMSLDGNTPFVFGEDGTYNAWHWVQAPKGLKQLNLTVGRHTLRIMNREDGVGLDQILLTDSKRVVPVGIQDVTATAP